MFKANKIKANNNTIFKNVGDRKLVLIKTIVYYKI